MNPYRVLGIPEDTDDDDAIRNAWLEGVRRFPPEKEPERFARNREAYEMIRDRESRFRLRTFGDPRLLADAGALVDFFPAERNHAGPVAWLAVTRGGTR
jgi:curved DNA-binding protein CbpA